MGWDNEAGEEMLWEIGLELPPARELPVSDTMIHKQGGSCDSP